MDIETLEKKLKEAIDQFVAELAKELSKDRDQFGLQHLAIAAAAAKATVCGGKTKLEAKATEVATEAAVDEDAEPASADATVDDSEDSTTEPDFN